MFSFLTLQELLRRSEKKLDLVFDYAEPGDELEVPANIYLLQFKNSSTRTKSEICSKLIIKTPEQRRFGVFIVNSEHISHLFVIFLLLPFNR